MYYQIKNQLEEAYLLEMAYERPDAIDHCASIGKLFIEHFHKLMNEPVNSDDFDHHCNEMQSWFNDVKKIVLKYNKKLISNTQLIDWFFTIGSSIEYIIDEPYQDIYEKFIIKLLQDRETSTVKEAIKSLL